MVRQWSRMAAILALGWFCAVNPGLAAPAAAGDPAEEILVRAMREVEAVDELVRLRERILLERKGEIQRLCVDWGIEPSRRPGASSPESATSRGPGRWEFKLSREAAAFLEALDERVAALRGARIALDFHRRRLRDELLRARALHTSELDGMLSSLAADLEIFRKLAAAPLHRHPPGKSGA